MASEFDWIDLFAAPFGVPRAPRGPGDDCAVVPPARGELCVTTDAVFEGVHFSSARFSPEDIGHKALAVNLSDLASMGAKPTWFVCALALPPTATAKLIRGLARGMSALARQSGIRLVGGNFTRASELSITVTAAGEVPRGGALLRSGGRPGDVLFVTGTLGDARLGLLRLQAGITRAPELRRQRRPTPKLRAGLIARRFASAAVDLSDGLAQDLGHLCKASGVGAHVSLERLPLSRAMGDAFASAEDAALLALAGGEDYELLLAVPPARAAAFARACRRAGEQVTDIGVLTRGDDLLIESASGARIAPPEGHDHFRASNVRKNPAPEKRASVQRSI